MGYLAHGIHSAQGLDTVPDAFFGCFLHYFRSASASLEALNLNRSLPAQFANPCDSVYEFHCDVQLHGGWEYLVRCEGRLGWLPFASGRLMGGEGVLVAIVTAWFVERDQ